jgi:magnesium-transporting ATPase (P-type)
MTLTDPHSQPADTCLSALDSAPAGLSTTEAARRLAEHGPNRLPEMRAHGPLMRFLVQFHNVLIYVLLGAAVVTGVLQHWVDTGVILAVVLAVVLANAAIRGMLAPRAAVLRDGVRVTLDGADLVPGDVVLLEAGDKVPADLRVLEARGLAALEGFTRQMKHLPVFLRRSVTDDRGLEMACHRELARHLKIDI